MHLRTSSILSLCLVLIRPGTVNAQAYKPQHLLVPAGDRDAQQEVLSGTAPARNENVLPTLSNSSLVSDTLRDLAAALDVMQDSFFQLWLGNWPSCNDWTAAVMGTQVSATLSSLTSSRDDILMSLLASTGYINGDSDGDGNSDNEHALGAKQAQKTPLAFENLINRFFTQTSAFHFGENSFGLRNEAYDDMLWVVLGWLENIKFQVLHSDLRYNSSRSEAGAKARPWHGTQFQVPAAHRARLFHELASGGWDVALCNGGMIWNPSLSPYKNAITNELFISASVGMYLYFPGDVIESPFVAGSASTSTGHGHDPIHLHLAIEGYRWLNNSRMTIQNGLYGDGFHINGWESAQRPGTRKCDVLNTMVYTYNQGVILSGLRGLWLATGSKEYLRDGHDLVQKVIRATGWPNRSSDAWAGLGRGGVLEDACDAPGDCSQDGQTFKGIFFHHFTEFCRPQRPQEERFLMQARRQAGADHEANDWTGVYRQHQDRCREYGPWVEHNAQAALKTRNERGLFGMWWGQTYGVQSAAVNNIIGSTLVSSPLARGAIDYRNHGRRGDGSEDLIGVLHNGNATGAAEDARTRAFDRDHSNIDGSQSTTSMGGNSPPDYNNRSRGRTVETQAGGVAVLRALYEWRKMS